MDRAKYKELSKAAEDGTIPDKLNPIFLFQTISQDLLLAVAKGEVDAMELAKFELAGRGIGTNGLWVGFDKADKQWGLK